MADNIAVTPGSGVTMATDETTGGVHTQIIKEDYGSNGILAGDVKFATVAASASGDNIIVAAVTGKKIKVIGYLLSASAIVNAKWRSATTDISGLLYMDAKGGAVAPEAKKGWFTTASGVALNLNLSAAVAVGGHVAYVEE